MITAYNKYKEQLQKQQEGRKKTEKAPQSPEEVLQWLAKTTQKLAAIDTTSYTEEQRAALNRVLMDFQTAVDALMQPQTAPEIPFQ